MVDIPEEKQARALRALVEAVRVRDDALAAVRTCVIDAARVGANRTRIKQIAGISSSTLYALINEAGIEVRPKQPAARKTDEGEA